MRFLCKININKHNTISSLLCDWKWTQNHSLLCYYVPYDIGGLNNVCQSVIFQAILLNFLLCWGKSKRFLFSWEHNIFTIYVFVCTCVLGYKQKPNIRVSVNVKTHASRSRFTLTLKRSSRAPVWIEYRR